MYKIINIKLPLDLSLVLILILLSCSCTEQTHGSISGGVGYEGKGLSYGGNFIHTDQKLDLSINAGGKLYNIKMVPKNGRNSKIEYLGSSAGLHIVIDGIDALIIPYENTPFDKIHADNIEEDDIVKVGENSSDIKPVPGAYYRIPDNKIFSTYKCEWDMDSDIRQAFNLVNEFIFRSDLNRINPYPLISIADYSKGRFEFAFNNRVNIIVNLNTKILKIKRNVYNKIAQQVDAPEPATMVSPALQTPHRPAR